MSNIYIYKYVCIYIPTYIDVCEVLLNMSFNITVFKFA